MIVRGVGRAFVVFALLSACGDRRPPPQMADVPYTDHPDAGSTDPASSKKPADVVVPEPPAIDMRKLAPSPVSDWLGRAPAFAFAIHRMRLKNSDELLGLVNLRRDEGNKLKLLHDASDVYGWALDVTHFVVVFRTVSSRAEALSTVTSLGFTLVGKPRKLKGGVVERTYRKTPKEGITAFLLPDDSIVLAADPTASKVRASFTAAPVPPPPPVFEGDEDLAVYLDQSFVASLSPSTIGGTAHPILGALQHGYAILSHKGAAVGRAVFADAAAADRAVEAFSAENMASVTSARCPPLAKAKANVGHKDATAWFKLDNVPEIAAETAKDPACQK